MWAVRTLAIKPCLLLSFALPAQLMGCTTKKTIRIQTNYIYEAMQLVVVESSSFIMTTIRT